MDLRPAPTMVRRQLKGQSEPRGERPSWQSPWLAAAGRQSDCIPKLFRYIKAPLARRQEFTRLGFNSAGRNVSTHESVGISSSFLQKLGRGLLLNIAVRVGSRAR